MLGYNYKVLFIIEKFIKIIKNLVEFMVYIKFSSDEEIVFWEKDFEMKLGEKEGEKRWWKRRGVWSVVIRLNYCWFSIFLVIFVLWNV